AVAGVESGAAGADAFHHAREFAARRERKRRLGLILAGDDQRVEEIHPDRSHLGHDLARCRDGIGDIGEHEVVGGAEALAENGFHGGEVARTVSARYSTNGAVEGQGTREWDYILSLSIMAGGGLGS